MSRTPGTRGTGLKAPSVLVGSARPPAPPSASGSSSSGSNIPSAIARSARAASTPQLLHGQSGLRMRTASSMSKTSQGNQPQYDDDTADASSDDGGWKASRPAPIQRASTTSALQSRSTASPMVSLESSYGLPATKSDNIRVVLRIRPPRPPNSSDDDVHDDGGNNQLGSTSRSCLELTPDSTGVVIAPGSMQEKRFMFDRVFGDECNQEDIFQDAGLMAVENTLNGFNGCIFAYGQTGSGKTFTMLGGGDSGSGGQYDAHELKVSPLRGLMPRIFDHLIRRLEDLVSDDSNDLEYTLSCSYLEIYNEKVFDLLEVGAATAQPKNLREDSIKKEVYVDQLRQIPIKSAAEAIEWLQVGSRNRRMASTDMNRESSRSHAVFTIRVLQTHHTDRGVLITRRSNLHLVDLAGSEKQRQTKAAGQRLKEAAQINKSLSALGNVIMALVDVSNGLKRHVHYRDSKLTFLLRDSLGGNSITTIIGTISGEEKYFSETLSTLKFAQRAKFIKNKAVQNEDSDAMIPLLKQEIERLRIEIAAMKKAAANAQSTEASHSVPRHDHQPEHHYPSPYSYIPQPAPPRINKWEPALEMMERLLKASGAANTSDAVVEIEVLELRCQRLEMLLYRMICRFEDQKVATFSAFSSSSRPRVPQPPQPTISRAPSMLRKPKIRPKRDENQDDDARSTSSNTTSTTNNNADLEIELNEQTARNAELEAENSLFRQQLTELMEWKTFMTDERRRSTIGITPSTPAVEQTVSDGDLQATRIEELLQALNAYRNLFGDLTASLQDKRDSPSDSSFNDDRSVSGMSFADDDNESIASEAELTVELEDDEVFGTEQGIRRIQNVVMKLDRKMEMYQDKIQQLQRSLVAAQDDVETATAATTYAEGQMKKLQADHQAELEAAVKTTRSAVQTEIDALNESLAKAEREHAAAINRVEEVEDTLQGMIERHKQERSEMEKEFATSMDRFEHDRATQDSEMEKLRSRLEEMMQSTQEDGDAQLIVAMRRVRELEEQLDRTRASSIVDVDAALFIDPRARAQSTPVARMMNKGGDDASSYPLTPDKVLEDVIAHNGHLRTMVRELQDEKKAREEQHLKEIERLRDESDALNKRLAEMRRLAVGSLSPSTHAKQKAETDKLIARLRDDRDSLRNQLKHTKQQVSGLEDQLSRSQSANATRRSIPSDFLFEM